MSSTVKSLNHEKPIPSVTFPCFTSRRCFVVQSNEMVENEEYAVSLQNLCQSIFLFLYSIFNKLVPNLRNIVVVDVFNSHIVYHAKFHKRHCALFRADIRSSPAPTEARSALSGRLALKKTPHRELGSTKELCALTPRAFKAIREQMALSLERTRQLEEQIKQLPALKVS